MPLNILQSWYQLSRGIGSQTDDCFHHGSGGLLSLLIECISHHKETESSALHRAMTYNFAKGLFPCPVKDISNRRRNSG